MTAPWGWGWLFCRETLYREKAHHSSSEKAGVHPQEQKSFKLNAEPAKVTAAWILPFSRQKRRALRQVDFFSEEYLS